MTAQKTLKTIILVMALLMVLLYGIGARMIFKGVQQYAQDAQVAYGGEPVVALIALVEDENAPFEKRNSAIWALGQLGNRRALPILQQLDTDEVQAPPYDSTAYIVQYSVEKAIKHITGFTVTKWMYRWL